MDRIDSDRGGLLAVTFRPKESGKVVVHALGQTNISGQIHRVILVSNGTDKAHLFTAWAEWTTNGGWKRTAMEDYKWLSLEPHQSEACLLKCPGHETRIALACFPKGSELAHWVDWVKTKVGMQS